MFRNVISASAVVAALVGLATPAIAANGAEHSLAIRLAVPVLCKVRFTANGLTSGNAAAVDLGELGEFCNDGAGYSVVVDYTPGTLRGAVLQLGENRVVLNGSGEAVISQADGPRILRRHLLATAGAGGFDTAQLSFEMRPAA